MAKTSYQAAARLVEREAGAFFGGGRSRSADTPVRTVGPMLIRGPIRI